jgi:hypothetical protein
VNPKNDRLLCAAATMDWQQVVLNGGPPCFHLEPGSIKFCGRAERWAGHDGKSHHDFVSLRDLLEEVERSPATVSGDA